MASCLMCKDKGKITLINIQGIKLATIKCPTCVINKESDTFIYCKNCNSEGVLTIIDMETACIYQEKCPECHHLYKQVSLHCPCPEVQA